MLLTTSICQMAQGQEIFFEDDGKLYNMPPNNLYLTQYGDYGDFMTKDVEKNLRVTGATTAVYSRFYHNTTMGFQTNYGHLQIPSIVFQPIISSVDKGVTISAWLRFANPNGNVSIGFWGTSIDDAAGAKVDVALINKKIVIRKKTRLNNEALSPIIETDFTIDYNEIFPTQGDITNGYVYFSLSTTKDLCRITMSRPGGRLYTKYFYIGLSDVLTSADSFFFGKSPVLPLSGYEIPSAFDDIMVYSKYLSTTDELNAFYMQSPLYPGVSYLFNYPYGYSAAPEHYNNATQVFNDDYIKWFAGLQYPGAYSSNKWFIHHVKKGTTTMSNLIYFANARSGANIYQKYGGNYVEQLREPSASYADRTQYTEKRYVTPQNLYNPQPDLGAGDYIGSYWFYSSHAPTYTLGYSDGFMYLNNATFENSLRVVGAEKVHARGGITKADIYDPNKQYVKIKNHMLKKYIDIHWAGEYYYAVLSDRDDTQPNQRFLLVSKSLEDYQTYKGIEIRTMSGTKLSPYWGKDDQKEDEFIVVHSQDFQWELVYVRNDGNDKPLYAIRAYNSKGSYLLGYKEKMGTNPYYLCQASAGAYTATGDVTDGFLWSIDVMSADTHQ